MDLKQIPRTLRIFFKFGMISPVMRLEFCFNVMLRKRDISKRRVTQPIGSDNAFKQSLVTHDSSFEPLRSIYDYTMTIANNCSYDCVTNKRLDRVRLETFPRSRLLDLPWYMNFLFARRGTTGKWNFLSAICICKLQTMQGCSNFDHYFMQYICETF